jgi:hypothetical protein
VSDTRGHTLAPPSGVVAFPRRLPAGRPAAVWAADWPRTTRLLPWTLAAFMVMLWVTPFDNTELPIPLPLDATLDRPLLLALMVLWAVALATREGVNRLSIGPVHWAFAVFGLIAVASILLNFDVLTRLGEASPAVKKLALLFTYGVLFVIAASAIRPSEIPKFTALMVGLASLTAIGVIVEYRTGFNAFYSWGGQLFPGVTPPEDIGGYDSIGRKTIVGPGSHPLAVAMMLAVAVPFAVVGVLRSPDRRRRALYGVAAALMLGAAVATQRKTSFIVPAVALAVLFAYRPRPMLKLIPLALVFVVMITALAPGALGGIADQLKPGAFTGVLTTKDRVSDYDAIRPEVMHHPLVGRGYESFDQKKYRILDNQYLTLLVNVGFLGLFAYLGVMLAAFVLAHRSARARDPDRRWFGAAAAAAIAGITVGSALLDTLALPQLPYLFCFVAALTAIYAQHGSAERTTPARTFVP